MNIDKLARMANQIAANLEYGPNEAQVVASIADHLLRFWTPEMRAELADGHARGEIELKKVAALALAATMQPDAKVQKRDTGGDAG